MIGDEGYFLHRSLSKLMENRTSSPCSLLFSYLCPRRKPSEHKGSGKDVGKPWCFCGLGSFEVVRTTLVAAAKQEKRKMSSWCQKNLWAIPGPLKEASHGELGLRVIATMSSRWRQYNNNNDNRLIIYINDNVIVYNGIPWWLSRNPWTKHWKGSPACFHAQAARQPLWCLVAKSFFNVCQLC